MFHSKKPLFPILFFLILTLNALARAAENPADTAGPDSCPALRLDEPQADGTPGSMQFVEVRNQGTYGICYAEVGTEMVDAYRFGALADPRTAVQSAVMPAAIGLANKDSSDPFSGGDACNVADYVSKNGYYNAFSVTKCILKSETKAVIPPLYQFYDTYSKRIAAARAVVGTNLAQARATAKAELGQQVRDWLTASGVPDSDQPPLATLNDFWDLGKLPFVWGIVTYQCYQKSPLFEATLPRCNYENKIQAALTDIESEINRLLALPHAQPVAIGYCADLLKKGVAALGASRTGAGPRCLGATPQDSLTHASLVIGRRWNPTRKKCQFLVRNSWGRSCKHHDAPLTLPPGLKSDPAFNPHLGSVVESPVYPAEWQCEEGKGNVWVDDDALMKSTYKIETLSNTD